MNYFYKILSRKIAVLVCFALFPSLLLAGRQIKIGSPSSILSEVESLSKIRKEKSEQSTFYNFKSDKLKNIPTRIDELILQNGYFAMRGKATQSKKSEFMLKGDIENIYGWVVLHDDNKAYEYTTNSMGEVVVQEVPVTKIIPICEIGAPAKHETTEYSNCSKYSSRFGDLLHLGDYPTGMDITTLQSKPDNEKVMYLDITRLENDGVPISPITYVYLWQTWQCVASGLINFEVNVTTDPDIYQDALTNNVKNTGISRFYNQEGRSNAPLNSFGSTSYSSLYRKPDGYDQGRTGWHEIGHQLGLSHDGTPSSGYFTGIKAFEWVPIMGNYRAGTRWDEALYQWSKGEYSNANQQQDDLDIINTKYLEYKADDFPSDTPLVITNGTMVIDSNNYGCIEENTDTDQFSFEVGSEGGIVNLRIDRIEYIGGSMLDVEAEIFDGTGNSVDISNAQVARHAEFVNLDLDPGSYILEIRGGAEGTPSNGFSNYSSLGYYAIDGTITGATTAIIAVPHTIKKLAANVSGNIINYSIPENMHNFQTDISIYNINGKMVKNIYKEKASKGTHNINIEGINLASGYYLCRINVGKAEFVLPIVFR